MTVLSLNTHKEKSTFAVLVLNVKTLNLFLFHFSINLSCDKNTVLAY